MLDFRELPDDGAKFEQLVRELFIRADFEVHWTGVGPDGGRDLIAVEKAQGSLAGFERRWLISCKHFAHSGRSVSPGDIEDIPGTCAAARANGFLLACSTQPSSATVRRLEETEANTKIVCRYWDCIEIEKRMNNPSTFALVNLFFPAASAATPWKIYNTMRPSFWAANYKEYFLYLGSRTSNLFPTLADVEAIIQRMESVQLPGGSDWSHHYLRPRAIYFDDKHEQYVVFLDYIFPRDSEQVLQRRLLNNVLQDGSGLYFDDHSMWKLTHWDVRYIPENQMSDHFHLDHKDYYEPNMDNFRNGMARQKFLSDMLYLDSVHGIDFKSV